MVSIPAGKVRQYIKSPDTSIRTTLIYGPDAGMVRETASNLSKILANSGSEGGEIIIVDENDPAVDPDKLSIELQMIPMFGGTKVVRYRPGPKTSFTLLQEILDTKNLPAYLVVEGGDLKKTAKLRKLFEQSKTSNALPCYADSGRDIAEIIREECANNNITISPDARQYLVSMLGADRGLSRTEIQKLITYAQSKSTIEIEDINAIVGDSSALSIDAILFSATSGRLKPALEAFDKAIASGNAPASILILLNRHLTRLHKVRSEVDRGENIDTAVKRLRPPPMFQQQNEFKALANRWSEKKLLTALDLTQQTTIRCRSRHAALEVVFIERLLMNISQMAGR